MPLRAVVVIVCAVSAGNENRSGLSARYNTMNAGLKVVFDVVLVGFLDDYFVFADANEHFVTNCHSSDGKFVFVEIDVGVVVIAVFSFRPTGAELLFPNHWGGLLWVHRTTYLNILTRAFGV